MSNEQLLAAIVGINLVNAAFYYFRFFMIEKRIIMLQKSISSDNRGSMYER